ncbi:MAG: acyltransferase [Eubacterium sp.]|nr:acyltransferase [Eubacterium sp.]
MTETKLKKTARQGNFELLRIIAMIMIVTLHYLGKGKLLNLDNGSNTYFVAWFCEALSYVAVNVYVLISGYFIKSTKFRFNKILDLWIQTIIISGTAYIIALKTGISEEFKSADFFKSFMPITRNSYWFITTYFVFCAIAPFLVNIVNTINQKQHKTVCATLVFITSVLPTIFFEADWLKISKGYHIIWFVTLFFVASYIRKYDTFKKSPFFYFVLYLASCTIGYVIKFVLCYLTLRLNNTDKSDKFFANYNMFFVFLASVFLFLAFKNIKINSNILNKIILFFSSTTLYVYLIHEAPSTRSFLWEKIVNPMGHLGFPDIIINYIVGIFGVYFACTVLGYIIKTVYSLLQLPKLTLLISNVLSKLTNKIMESKLISKH